MQHPKETEAAALLWGYREEEAEGVCEGRGAVMTGKTIVMDRTEGTRTGTLSALARRQKQ